jgi:membrane protease YdiL (CAAX protease family)
MHLVQRLFQSDLAKVILFFILTVVTSAIIAPWLYNAGMLLAEVGKSRSLNPALDWLAERCSGASFATFYKSALLGCALILGGPFIMWCRLLHPNSQAHQHPWRLRIPNPANSTQAGQALGRNPQAKIQFVVGFLITASLTTLSMWWLKTIGWLSFEPSDDYILVIGYALVSAMFIAVVHELLFRGMLMGMCLRALGPVMAIICISLAYATVLSILPSDNMSLTKPDQADAGFRMITTIIKDLFTPEKFTFGFITAFTFGLVLAYARYRTASLWLPIGLHFGMAFILRGLQPIITAEKQRPPMAKLFIGSDGMSGILPLCLMLAAALLVHISLQVLYNKHQSEA